MIMGLVATLLGFFFTVVFATIWFGFWNNIITLCNFFIAAIAGWGMRPIVSRYFEDLDPNVAQFGDFIAVWGVFVLVTIVLRVATDTLSTIRLRFHPALEIVGRIGTSLVLAGCFMLFAASTISLLRAEHYVAQDSGNGNNSLLISFESLGWTLWNSLADYWSTGPFNFY